MLKNEKMFASFTLLSVKEEHGEWVIIEPEEEGSEKEEEFGAYGEM